MGDIVTKPSVHVSRKLFFFSLVALVLSCSILVRSPVLYQSGNEPVGYSGPLSYAIDFAQTTGHLINEDQVYAPTQYSRAIYYGEEAPLGTLLPAIMGTVVGSSPLSSGGLLVPFFLTIAFIFAVASCLFSSTLWGAKRMNLAVGVLALMVIAFGNVGVFNLIGGANAGFEIVVILICLRMLLVGPLTKGSTTALFVMSAFLPMFHFTAGVVYVSFLCGVLILARYWRHFRVSPKKTYFEATQFGRRIQGYALAYLLFYCGYIFLFSPLSLTPYTSLISDFTRSGPSRTSILGDYIAGSSHDFFVLNAISMILYIIPSGLVLLWLLRNSLRERSLLFFAACLGVPFALMGAVFFVWMGILGVFQRLTFYSIYPIVHLVRFGPRLGRSFTILLAFILIAGAPFAQFIFVESPYNKGNYAVAEEEQLADWTVSHSEEGQMVFTDLRLSGLLISQGHLYTVGISDSAENALSVPPILQGLFYSPTAESLPVGIGLVETAAGGIHVDLIFVSDRMSNPYPGILGYSYTYKPAASDFFDSYDSIAYLNLVSSTGSGRLYSYSL